MKLHKKSCGVIPVFNDGKDCLFLVVHQTNGIWCFPKGGQKAGETDAETALRELEEETGINKVSLLDGFCVEERYDSELDGVPYSKEVQYFIGVVDSKNVVLQMDEIQDYKWANFKQASKLFTYRNTSNILSEAHTYLKNNLSNPQ